jgi:hypothetical protein
MKAVLSSAMCSSWSSQICEFVFMDHHKDTRRWGSTVYIIRVSSSLLQYLCLCVGRRSARSDKYSLFVPGKCFNSHKTWHKGSERWRWKSYHRQNTKQSLEVYTFHLSFADLGEKWVYQEDHESSLEEWEKSNLRDHMLCVTGDGPRTIRRRKRTSLKSNVEYYLVADKWFCLYKIAYQFKY